ncbi:MAG: HAMP domain-containing histidine kinase [Bacteroidetes bacterium]|nr:HAMP domain-containing histidine kinase [Bacteroidota bacterium]
MNRMAFRFSLILGFIAVILIIVVQVYFMQTAFNQEERRVNQSIQIALRNVAEQLALFNQSDLPYENPVQRLRPDYYVVNVNTFIDAEILEYYLITEFMEKNIDLDFEFGIYDCQTDEIVYGRYVTFGSGRSSTGEDYQFSKYADYLYYFGIYFQGRSKWILSNLTIWYFFSAVLAIVLIFFIYSQVVILRQRRMSEIQRDFINNLTHEFHTPLSSILMSAEVFVDQDTSQEPERVKTYGRIIRNQTRHILSQIDRILDQSGKGGSLRPKKELFDLTNLLQSMEEEFKIPIRNKEGSLRMELPDQAVLVNADALMIRQVLFNLIDNAIKYSADNPAVDIIMTIQGKGGTLCIRDAGIGIPDQYRKRIYDRFFRVPAGNVHNVKGFGLGLHYVKRVLDQHGWKLRLQSKAGAGTSINIKFKSQ